MRHKSVLLLQEEPIMAVKQTNDEPEAVEPEREPGFYVGDNGPYLTHDDAQAFIDGHLEGKGKVTEVVAND
jgi:hypothetical protein